MEELNNIQIPYEDMLRAGMHFGRKRTVFNPAMERYVFTVKDGICIIDLTKTQAQLNNSVEFVKKIIKNNGLVLFVSLTKQSSEKVKELAESLHMPYVLDRWLGGTLTNFRVITERIKKLEEMEQAQRTGELEKMQMKFGGLKQLTRIPDAVFVSSLKESELPVHEAKKAGVKIVGIANTDSNPEEIDYIIPANDRSKKSVDLILEAVKNGLTNL